MFAKEIMGRASTYPLHSRSCPSIFPLAIAWKKKSAKISFSWCFSCNEKLFKLCNNKKYILDTDFSLQTKWRWACYWTLNEKLQAFQADTTEKTMVDVTRSRWKMISGKEVIQSCKLPGVKSFWDIATSYKRHRLKQTLLSSFESLIRKERGRSWTQWQSYLHQTRFWNRRSIWSERWVRGSCERSVSRKRMKILTCPLSNCLLPSHRKSVRLCDRGSWYKLVFNYSITTISDLN